jgi:hypothetical protein
MAPVAARSIGGVLRAISRRVPLGVALAVLLFMVYACTVFALPQVRDARYCCEQSSVAAAVSNALYGAPLGTSADLLFYCLFAVGLVLGAMLIELRRILQHPTKACAS